MPAVYRCLKIMMLKMNYYLGADLLFVHDESLKRRFKIVFTTTRGGEVTGFVLRVSL